MYASIKQKPSVLWELTGLVAKPFSNRTFATQSPDESPVNIRPVLFPPCAAGAKPTIKILPLTSPKPGSGLPQYFSSLNRFILVCEISLMYEFNLGHFLHLIILMFRALRVRDPNFSTN